MAKDPVSESVPSRVSTKKTGYFFSSNTYVKEGEESYLEGLLVQTQDKQVAVLFQVTTLIAVYEKRQIRVICQHQKDRVVDCLRGQRSAQTILVVHSPVSQTPMIHIRLIHAMRVHVRGQRKGNHSNHYIQ